jgi:uncharacterized protein
MGHHELAALCVLLLRGPQTLGEIKDRSERIFTFADLEETDRVLEKLAEWPSGPLAKKFSRQPGQKEARYGHLLAGEPEMEAASDMPNPAPDRLAQLESEVRALRIEIAGLTRRLEELEVLLR